MASATSGSGVEPCVKPGNGGPPQTPVLTVGCRMLRSPSHESVTTDLSLFSVSSLASEAQGTGARMRLVTFKSYSEAQLSARVPSPNPPNKASRPPDIPEILWFEEENDLIKSCAALSSALGFQKSFSTSDISTLPSPEETLLHPSRCAVSDLALSALQRTGYLLDHARLDHASRSCSTWVAVGDVASTSQLPSPHGGHSIPPAPTAAPPPVFTAADLIRSVNKKVRQNYIRRRLLTTYKALERLSQSEFNLDRLELQAVTEAERQSSAAKTTTTHLTVPGTRPPAKPVLSPGSVIRAVKPDNLTNKNFPLTLRDVERDRGKPLSKYERNMMIFNWLHTLDDTAFEGIQ
ncbi:hypothetical protein RUM43_007688 [Polyplax serrata]|uniref:Uncharacterized protein n=1 Tax=Polyplax serrata TaxID=468196 RepID=A0AAN8P625_POLSC